MPTYHDALEMHTVITLGNYSRMYLADIDIDGIFQILHITHIFRYYGQMILSQINSHYLPP